MSIRRFFVHYLNFSYSERLGICILLLLLVVIRLLPEFLPAPLPAMRRQDLEKQVTFLAADTLPTGGPKEHRKHKAPAVSGLFRFNPNHLPDAAWEKLGLKAWQVKMIRKYEARGGSFRGKEDLKKMYCINEALYQRLEPYIDLPAGKPAKQEPQAGKALLTELNTADSATLERLPGIGAYTASRLTRYRDRLGGFISVDQLREIKGISPANLDQFISHLSINPALVKKIPVNRVTAYDLSRHPYLSRTQAEALVNYRQAHGPFRSLPDLEKVVPLDTETLNRIGPYLLFD